MSLDDRLDRIINAELASHDLAGAALSVRKGGKEVFRRSYGVRDLEIGDAMPVNPIFRLYSMSKPLTSAAAMILLERGIISLDEPVYKYLDGFRKQTVWQCGKAVPAKRPVSINDLLNMTSGLSYPDLSTESGARMTGLFDEAIARANAGKGWPTLELCNRIGQIPLLFQPGEKWQYGTSADVLGAVIEAASGMSFRDFLKTELFEPLGMADTDFYLPAEKRGRFVTMYEWHPEAPKLRPYTGYNLAILNFESKPAFESGGAGLVSTPDDYGRFAQMLQNHGELDGRRILKPETVDFMHSDRLSAAQKLTFNWLELRGFSYGNLMRVLVDVNGLSSSRSGIGAAGEYGWDGWAGSYYESDPVNEITLIYLISRINMDNTALRAEIRRAIYDYLAD